MSSSRHIKLNDRWYRLAEDAEGQHYDIKREPLRIPNAQVVRGDSGQFQLRPDLMQWSITNWAEGEGQLKFDPTQPGRSTLIMNTDPFVQPGNLTLGPLMARIQYLSSDVNKRLTFVKGPGSVIFGVQVEGASLDIWKFSSSTLDFDATYAAGTGGGTTPAGACGDNNSIFSVDSGTDNIYRFNGSTFALHNDQTGVTSTDAVLVELGDYVYVYDPEQGKVFEISKATANTATPEVALYDFSSSGGSTNSRNSGIGYMVAGDNRIYVLQRLGSTTVVHELVPTSAASAGYGRELTRIVGTVPYGLTWFGGFLLLLGQSYGLTGRRYEAFYLQPDGALGTMGEIRSHIGGGPAGNFYAPGSSNLRYVSFLGPDYDADAYSPALFLMDTVSGGFGQVSSLSTDTTAYLGGNVAETAGVWCIPCAVPTYAYATNPTKYLATGYVISPYYDFDLADEKVLREITVTCEPLPADTTIQILYDTGTGSFTSAGTLSTTASEGATFTISTDTTTKTFRHMRVKTILSTTDNTKSPVVRSVEVRSSVIKYINVWNLLIDLSDDLPNQGRGGANDIASLLALSENTVYAFRDAYRSHAEGTDTEYDVELDSVGVTLSQPGEGVAQVVLREA